PHIFLEPAKPPSRDLSEHGTLVRDRLGHDDIERAHPIGRHEEQAEGIYLIHLADLAPSQVTQGKGRQPSDGHIRTSSRSAMLISERASTGPTTSSRNSSTCCGARPKIGSA